MGSCPDSDIDPTDVRGVCREVDNNYYIVIINKQ